MWLQLDNAMGPLLLLEKKTPGKTGRRKEEAKSRPVNNDNIKIMGGELTEKKGKK